MFKTLAWRPVLFCKFHRRDSFVAKLVGVLTQPPPPPAPASEAPSRLYHSIFRPPPPTFRAQLYSKPKLLWVQIIRTMVLKPGLL